MKVAAIVGAGPSGFYTADQLLKAGVAVDMYDALPTPYGLVRAGVAPDHPKIKTVTRVFAKIAEHPGFRFFGGVTLGAAISREDLCSRYHAVVYAIGTPADQRLRIPGEDRPGSHAATAFVGWYNGHPDYAEHTFDLSVDRAVVVGNGNVAIDVARMLVLDPSELASTDTTDSAIAALESARVHEVVLLGRRGPAQAAFTTPELRELGDLRRADVVVDPAQLPGVGSLDDPSKLRNLELLRDYAASARSDKTHQIELRFLRSPIEIVGEGENGRVTGVRVAVNELVDGLAVPTGEEELIECGLVLRSIGYRGRPLAGIPFDETRGLIRNQDGRVCTEDGRACASEYCVGWIKRGPSGVIGTNKKDAAATVERILEDCDAGRLQSLPPDQLADNLAWLRRRVPQAVTWAGWQRIDRREIEDGEPQGRPRVKLVRLDQLLEVASTA